MTPADRAALTRLAIAATAATTHPDPLIRNLAAALGELAERYLTEESR